MQRPLPVLKMKAGNAEGRDILADDLCAASKTQQYIGRRVIAEGDRHLQKSSQGNLHACIWILVLKRAVGLGQNEVRSQEPDWLVKGVFSTLRLMQNGQRHRQFEDRLHWWVARRIKIAVQLRARQ